MDKQQLLNYLLYLRDSIYPESNEVENVEAVNFQLSELKSRIQEVETLDQRIRDKVMALKFDDTLSYREEERFFFGLIPNIWGFREEEKRYRGLLSLKGKIDHLIFELKSIL